MAGISVIDKVIILVYYIQKLYRLFILSLGKHPEGTQSEHSGS
jgi:hypothetical protein